MSGRSNKKAPEMKRQRSHASLDATSSKTAALGMSTVSGSIAKPDGT